MANLGCVEVEYFDFGYGRGDLIRQMCAAGKVQFKDTFISQADWPAVKGDTAKYPTGGLPVATINGCKMGETCAIVRFLAISTGWYPTDPMCAWAADTNLDMWTDCINSMGAVLFAPEEKKEECMAKFLCCVETFCKVASERMEHCKWKHTAGDKPSVGDVAIYTLWANLGANEICPFKEPVCAIFAKYPCLNETLDCMKKCNASYVDTREKKPM